MRKKPCQSTTAGFMHPQPIEHQLFILFQTVTLLSKFSRGSSNRTKCPKTRSRCRAFTDYGRLPHKGLVAKSYLFSHIGIDLIAIGITGLILTSDGNRGSNHREIRVRRQRPSAVAFLMAGQLRKIKDSKAALDKSDIVTDRDRHRFFLPTAPASCAVE